MLAYSYAETFFTLLLYPIFFNSNWAFLLITILELFYFIKRCKDHRNNIILSKIKLLSRYYIWRLLSFKLALQMKSMINNVNFWNNISVREIFSELFLQCQLLAETGLLITMILTWLTRNFVFRPLSSSN